MIQLYAPFLLTWLSPPGPDTDNEMEKIPVSLNSWEGFLSVELVPSPKSHLQSDTFPRD